MKNILYILLLFSFGCYAQGIPRKLAIKEVSGISSSQNNYNLDLVDIVKLSSTQEISITGIVAQIGAKATLHNTGSFTITLKYEDSNSTDVNRFVFASGADYVLPPGRKLTIYYDATDERWLDYEDRSLGSVSLPAPSIQSSSISFSAITSGQATISCTSGNGGFRLFVVSANPIASFPINNVQYGENTIFPNGSDLGGGVYVVSSGTDVSVVVTGLSAATLYYAMAMEYDISGSAISYNTNVGSNSSSFTTLSNATTPTEQWVTTNVRSEEDRLRIQGVRGNGDNIVVVASTEGKPDTDIADGVDPTAAAYGAGTAVGNGYVVYEGSASDFHITGVSRDRMVWWKVMEREDTGFLYNTQAPIDSAWTAFIYDSLFTESTASAGQTYLEANARVFYDFTRLTGTDGTNISNGNAGLEDYSANVYTATIVNTPTVEDLTITPYSTKSLGTTGTNVITTGHDGTSWFTSDFRITMSFWIADGQPASGNQYLFGVQSTGVTHIMSAWLASASNNEINIRFRTPTADSRWDSNNTALLADGPGFYVLEIEYDFTTDAIEVMLNGSAVTGAFASGSMAALNPADFDPDVNFAIGSSNNGGTIQNNATEMQISRFTVTGLPTSQQITDTRDYFDFIPSASGSGFANWTANETVGFTNENVSDSLHLSGNPAGYEDYMVHNEILPDTLEEWRMGYVVKINAALTTSTIGTGIGVQNDISSEANRGVRVLFVTDTDSPNFGRIQLYSGTGNVGPTNFSYRSQSSGSFVPALDSVYHIYLERKWLSNDAFYVATIYDASTFSSGDSISLTTSWTELNRTSSPFYGTTTEAIIWQNGGDFMVNPFQVVRVGLNSSAGGSPPPAPGEISIDVFVSKSGNDANACTESLPCLTVNRGFARGVELGGSFDMSIGAGTYIEDYLSVPITLDTLVGAGMDLTIIKGSPATYTATTVTSPSRSSLNNYLFNMQSGSSTAITTTMIDFTIDGNWNTGGNTNSTRGGIALRFRDGLELRNVRIRYFNTCGLWAQEVDGLDMDVCEFIETSGIASTFAYYQVQWYNVNDVTISNSLISAPTLDKGAGLGFQGGSGDNRYMTNVTLDNVTFNVNPESSDSEGHNFDIEWIYTTFGNILIQNCYFRSNLSFNQRSASLGNTRITNCVFDLPVTTSLAVEMQIDNCEIDHCYIKGARNGVFAIYNAAGTSPSAPLASFSNWDIHHNLIELTNTNSFVHGIVGGSSWPVDDIHFYNNTVVFGTTSGQGILTLVTHNTNTATGLVFENNAFHGQPPSGSNMWDTSGPISGGISRYNKATHLNVNQSRTGITVSNSSITGSGNTLGFNLTGSHFPVVPGSFWAWPGSNTVLKDQGLAGADIGAYDD